jgi:hypothetical protein
VTRRRRRQLALVGALIALPASATAQPSAGALTWDAPPGCPSAQDVEARIAARVETPPREVRVRVVEVPEGVRVDMSTDGADRTFVAPTCDDAATAVAVIVALAAHAKAQAAPPVLAKAPEVVPPRPAPLPLPPPAPSPPTRWSVSAAGVADTGSLPHVSPGIGLGIQARRGIGAVGLTASAFLPKTEHAAGEPAVQTTVTLVDLLALGCLLVPVLPRTDAGGCVGAGVGMLHGASGSIDRPRSNAGLRPEGVLLGRAEVAFSSAFSLRLEGGALADPIRNPFRVEGVGEVYRPPALALRFGLGLDIRFR